MIDAVVFDAYGTLFDVHSITARAEERFPGRGAALSKLWRDKQLEYTWLQGLMDSPARPRQDFAAVTAHALDHALEALRLGATALARDELLGAYQSLTPFPDVPAALRAIAPRPRCILSNGTRAMLVPLVRAAGLERDIDCIFSVDEAAAYKPDPRVYALAATRLGLAPARIGFVSSNCWDAIGAKAFGFTVFWINRAGAPVDRHGPAPDRIITTLAELPAALTASSSPSGHRLT